MYQKKRPQYVGAHWIVWSLWDFRSVRTVPPNLHLKKLNPNIDLSNFACCIPDSWHVFDVMDDTVISSLLWTSFHPAAIPGSILPSCPHLILKFTSQDHFIHLKDPSEHLSIYQIMITLNLSCSSERRQCFLVAHDLGRD